MNTREEPKINRLKVVFSIFIFICMLAAGCFSANSISEPVADVRDPAISASHGLWGLYQFNYDPVTQKLD